MNDAATLAHGDRVILSLRTPDRMVRGYEATYLGHTNQGFTVRIGAMTVERTYRWADEGAWISEPRTDVAYGIPDDDETLESIPPDLE